MPGYQRMLFVCLNDRGDEHPRGSCARAGGDQVLDRLGNHGGLVGADVDEIRSAAAAYADAGVDELVIADFNLPREAREDVLGRLQEEVLEEFR